MPEFHPFPNPTFERMPPPHGQRALHVGGGALVALLGTAGAYKLWRTLHPEEHEEMPAHVPEEGPEEGPEEKTSSDLDAYRAGRASEDPETVLQGELADAALARKMMPYALGGNGALMGGLAGYHASGGKPLMALGGAAVGGALGALGGHAAGKGLRSPYEDMPREDALARIREQLEARAKTSSYYLPSW